MIKKDIAKKQKRRRPLEKVVVLPPAVKAEISPVEIKISGPKGVASRKLGTKKIVVRLDGGKILLAPKVRKSRSEKALINSLVAHINNLVAGVQNEFVYRMKICASHFPMAVKLKGDLFEVNNFIGEKTPRVLKVVKDVDVKVEGDFVVVKSCDRELAGNFASRIEKLTKRPSFDRRVFMDGIYLVEKCGEKLK
jgi:large subunit ribosomal protein L6